MKRKGRKGGEALKHSSVGGGGRLVGRMDGGGGE